MATGTSSLSDLKSSLGDLVNVSPLVAASRGIAKVGEWAGDAATAAQDFLRPSAKRMPTDIALPKDAKRSLSGPRALSRSKR